MIEESKFQVSTLLFRSTYIRKKFPTKCNDKNLSLFINELADFTLSKHLYTVKECDNSNTACFYFQKISDESCEIFIHVNNKITGFIISQWIINNWSNKTGKILSNDISPFIK